MTFSHDTELSLLALVDLINTDPACGSGEGMPDAEASRPSSSDTGSPESIHETSTTSRPCTSFDLNCEQVFGEVDVAETAHRVNLLLADASVRPRLTDHDDYDWHMHYFAPGATLAEHVRVDGAMALAQVVSAEETERLRVCEAPDCEAVLVDLSRNRSKRYCDARTCGNRLNVAAYRQRKRSEMLLDEA